MPRLSFMVEHPHYNAFIIFKIPQSAILTAFFCLSSQHQISSEKDTFIDGSYEQYENICLIIFFAWFSKKLLKDTSLSSLSLNLKHFNKNQNLKIIFLQVLCSFEFKFYHKSDHNQIWF